MIERRTVRETVSFDGRGLHSGVPARVAVHPGENGIMFRCGAVAVQALPENVSDTTRCTRLGEISTVEHLMSAFAALEITDAEVDLSAPELPALDGSAAVYYSALQASGSERIGEMEMHDLFTRIFVQEDSMKIAVSKGSGHWAYRYDTGARWPGEMTFDCPNVVADYAEQIAPARTFAFVEEVEMARAAGLGQGLDETSVLILGSSGFEYAARFADEPPRHKLLDLIGDLYLSGVPISRLNVSAERSGHRMNVQAAAMLRKAAFG